MVSDTIGDFIIQLKNAGMVRKDRVSLPYSKLKHAIADTLQKEGYVAGVETTGKGVKKQLEVLLQYDAATGAHVINDGKRSCKPGRSLYTKVAVSYPVKFGKGRVILSTPAGILSGEEARKAKVGGEELFKIW